MRQTTYSYAKTNKKKNKYKEIKMYSFLQARKIQYITLNDYEYTKKINTKILNCK